MWLFNQREPHHISSCKFVFTSVPLSSWKQHIFNDLPTCSEQLLGTGGICVQDKPLWVLWLSVCMCVCPYVRMQLAVTEKAGALQSSGSLG